MKIRKTQNPSPVVIALLVIAVGLLAVNQYQISMIASSFSDPSTRSVQTLSTADPVQAAVNAVIPTGNPSYGNEIGLSFDEPIESLDILGQYDDLVNGPNRIVLSGNLQERYIKIGSSISCEFCCGATTLVTGDGSPACACSHSIAMRGLTKYLLQNHADMSDQEILDELVKWKSLYFPKEMVTRYLQEQGSTSPTVLSQLPDMTGGC